MSSITRVFSFPTLPIMTAHLTRALKVSPDSEVVKIITATFAGQTCEVSAVRRCIGNAVELLSPRSPTNAEVTEHFYGVVTACAVVTQERMPHHLSSH
jgi:hypothetical protein